MSNTPESPVKTGVKKAPPKSARRRAREFAIQGLYEWLLNRDGDNVNGLQVRQAEGFHKCDTAHFEAIIQGVMAQEGELTTHFLALIDRPVTELSPVERAALLLGSYELVNCLDIPYKVVINEAVELTKTFGGTDGFKYVNGVLDKLAAKVRAAEVGANSR